MGVRGFMLGVVNVKGKILKFVFLFVFIIIFFYFKSNECFFLGRFEKLRKM